MLAIGVAMRENYTSVILDRERPMSLGMADRQGNLLDDVDRFLDEALDKSSIYAFFHRERDALFPDEDFADLFDERGRRSVPPSVVAVVMALQRLEGLSDREAVERYTFDNRWRYACGVGGYDGATWTSFAHTVLVDMRERLRRSKRPNRIFEVALSAAKQAGLIGRRRVIDSTPLYDAVATMDTITLIRSAIRGLLKVAGDELCAELRGVITSGDDYTSAAKPQIDWEDEQARTELIDSRATDGFAMVLALSGRELSPAVHEAACLLLTVLGQDLEVREDGVFAIAHKVAFDRVISTVDPETRHGHKTSAHGFDGYKGHVAIDPRRRAHHRDSRQPGQPRRRFPGKRAARRRGRGRRGDRAGAPGRLRRQGLWHRRAAQPARGGRRHRPPEDPGPRRSFGALCQGPLRGRPRGRHRHLPGGRDGGDPPPRRRIGRRPLRLGLQRLPASRALHELCFWTGRERQPPRGRPRRSASPSARPRLARGLPGDTTESRAKARPLDAPSSRRKTGAHAWQGARRCRLRAARRGAEPGAPCRARAEFHANRLVGAMRWAAPDLVRSEILVLGTRREPSPVPRLPRRPSAAPGSDR